MRKIISIILALVVVICICESAPIKIVANAEEKINLWDGYIPISTKEDLNNIRYADFDNGQPKYYLTNDICFTEEDFSKGGAFYNNGEGWEPIPYFSGVFDGNGHNIVGLKINGNNNNVSDFGEIAFIEFNDGIIKNLGFSECSLNVSATSFSFGFSLIVCTNYGTISNCYVDSKSIVKILAYNLSEISFGAISNYNFGIIENCFNKAKITVKMEEKEFVEGNAGLIVGGITAFNYSKVSNCYNHGDIYCKTLFSIYNLPIDERGQYTTFSIIEFAISGIVGVQGSYDTAGFSESVTSNCYNKGNIDLKMKDTFGQESFILSDTLPACDVSGIVARNSSGIVNCSNEGRIIVAQERTIPSISVCIGSHRTTLGGISGSNSGNIIGCYNNGGLSLWQIWNGFQGGIVGVNDKGAIIEKSANYALLEGGGEETTVLGGFVGINLGVIQNSYNTGNVKRNSDNVCLASFCGSNAGEGVIKNCYNVGQNSGITNYSIAFAAGLTNNGLNSGVAAMNFESAIIKNAYYLNNADVGVCAGKDTTTKCTSTQMQQQSTFKGFDFTNVWTIDKNSDYKYPTLKDYSDFPNFYDESKILYLATPVATVKNSSTGVKVSWNAIDDATSYKVYRKTYNTKTKKYGSWKTCGTVTTTSYIDTKAKSGTKYVYTVKALNGDVKSGIKSSSSILFLAQPTVKIANASTGVKVSWNKITGATSYKVYRAEYKNGKWSGWKSVKTIAKGSTVSWTDTKAKSGVKYKYTVKAVNGKTVSTYKSSSSLLYLAQPKTTVKAASTGVKVAWVQSTGATSYKIYRSEYNTKTKKWSSWKAIKTAKSTSKSYTDKTAKKGVKYRYTVKAVNGKVASTYKASGSVKR